MNSKLLRRLESLEKRLTSGPIVLQMADGTMQTLRGRGDYASHMLGCALRGDRMPDMELLAESVGPIIEPGNGRLVEVARALIKGPSLARP